MGRDRVEEAFRAVPRRQFLPPAQSRFAGQDLALSIGHGQTNSQPSTVRDMLRLLDVNPGQRVLDVGCGSGWTTALLAWLVGPGGLVRGVERVPELVAFGRANLESCDLPWAEIEAADEHVLGRPAGAPYDRILVSAEARRLPADLVSQLATGGVLVVPVRGRMARVRRADGEPQVTWHGSYLFVPLVEPGRPSGNQRL